VVGYFSELRKLPPYDPIEAIQDKELIKLVLQSASVHDFTRREREWLEELIKRFEQLSENVSFGDFSRA
jgi:hypothetical protein